MYQLILKTLQRYNADIMYSRASIIRTYALNAHSLVVLETTFIPTLKPKCVANPQSFSGADSN